MLAMFIASSMRHTVQLYRAERIPKRGKEY
jgi:hypothetical protein